MKNFFNRTTNKHWQIEIDGQTIRTCLNGGKIKEIFCDSDFQVRNKASSLMMGQMRKGFVFQDPKATFGEAKCKWMRNEIRISLDVEVEKKASWTRARNVMKKLLADQESWDKSLRAMAAHKLTPLANEWLADNDQSDRDPENTPITEDEFARRIRITEFSVSPGGRFTAWFEDDDLFWGHVVTVDGTLKKGPIGADIQG